MGLVPLKYPMLGGLETLLLAGGRRHPQHSASSTAELAEALSVRRPALIFFNSPSCSLCRDVSPVVDAVSAQTLTVARVRADLHTAVAPEVSGAMLPV